MRAAEGPAAAPPPGFGLAWLDYWYGKLENFLNLLSALAIFVLMFVGVFQIAGRTLFDTAIYGYIDWIEQASIIYAMLGVAYCQREGGHIRMELLLASLRGRLLWFFEALAVLIGLVIVTLLIDSSWEHFLRAYTKGDSTIDIKLPIWPSKLVVPVALSVLWLRLLLQLAGYARLVIDPRRRPVAVPVVETVEQQAQREIEDVLGRTDPSRSNGAGDR